MFAVLDGPSTRAVSEKELEESLLPAIAAKWSAAASLSAREAFAQLQGSASQAGSASQVPLERVVHWAAMLEWQSALIDGPLGGDGEMIDGEMIDGGIDGVEGQDGRGSFGLTPVLETTERSAFSATGQGTDWGAETTASAASSGLGDVRRGFFKGEVCSSLEKA